MIHWTSPPPENFDRSWGSAREAARILGVLLVGEHRWRAFPGRTFWTYLLLYGAARIALELYRGDPRGMVFDALPTSQFVSALIVPASIAMLVYLGRRGAAAGAAGPPPTRARASAQ